MNGEKDKVLIIRPNQFAEIADVDLNDFESLSKIVGGYVEYIYPFEDNVAIIRNDAGLELPFCRALYSPGSVAYDTLNGTFIIAGVGDGLLQSLTPKMLAKYNEMFYYPENFILHSDGRGFEVIQYDPTLQNGL